MTISTSASQVTVLGNGATTSWDFSFIGDSEEFITVTFNDTDNTQTVLSTSSYTLVLNPPATGSLWGVGGTLVYPLVGSPIASGTSLTISRILPYTQVISISNQGDFAPQVIEEMGDTLEMQIQQLAARTTQFRGTWVTNTDYTVGDIVQDGDNGLDTGNYYICTIANTSDVWADDLAAGYWALSVTATVPSGSLTLTGDVTGSSTLGTPTATTIAANAVTNAKMATMPANTVKVNATSATSVPTDFTINLSTLLGRGPTGNIAALSLGSNLSISTSTLNVTNINIPYSYISGFLLSSIAGNSTTASLTVGAGQATDSTNVATISKATSTSWAVSNGNAINGYQGGTTLPNSDTIHIFMISKTDGTTASFAHNGLTPTLPTDYIYYRRVGSFNTTGAGAPLPYTAIEMGGGAVEAILTTAVSQTYTGSTGGALLVIGGVPTDIRVKPNIVATAGTSSTYGIISSEDATSAAPAVNGTAPGTNFSNDGGQNPGFPNVITNTSAQVRQRTSSTDTNYYIYCHGWTDFRRS